MIITLVFEDSDDSTVPLDSEGADQTWHLPGDSFPVFHELLQELRAANRAWSHDISEGEFVRPV